MHHKIEIPLLYMNSIYKILLKIKIQKINNLTLIHHNYNIEIPIQLMEAIYKNILKIKIEIQISHKNRIVEIWINHKSRIVFYDKLFYCLLNFI